MPEGDPYPDPREQDIMAGDRRISRPDTSLPDWYVSDTKYRPIPIAWFAAAILLQTAIVSALFFAFAGHDGWATLLPAMAASAGIAHWSWDRGLARAAVGWRAATIAVMSVQLGFIALGVSDRL